MFASTIAVLILLTIAVIALTADAHRAAAARRQSEAQSRQVILGHMMDNSGEAPITKENFDVNRLEQFQHSPNRHLPLRHLPLRHLPNQHLPAQFPGDIATGNVSALLSGQKGLPPVMYSAAEVDPMVTGTRYRTMPRFVYAERTSHGDEWGLEEYNDGNDGEVGRDIGPLGGAPRGRARQFDDGMPANWNFPSTPVKWYKTVGEDYYGGEGPTVFCGDGLEMTSVGDHQPLEN